MCKKNYYFICLLCIWGAVLSAQEAGYQLQGRCTDLEQHALPVSLILSDSSGVFLYGNWYDDGQFSVTTPQKTVRLRLQALGYLELDTLLHLVESVTSIGVVSLQENPKTLGEVQVSANRPVYQRSADGLRIEVENTFLSKSSSAAELLLRIPGVSVSANKPQVFGRGEALIYIDGKESTLESYKSVPPSEIKAIELITNPGPRYDARGKAVLVVHLKKGYRTGFSNTLANHATASRVPETRWGAYWQNTASAQIQYRKNKLNSTLYYANDAGTNWAENRFTNQIRQADGDYVIQGYYTEDNRNAAVHTCRAGIGYDLGNRSALSAQYDGLAQVFRLDVQQNSDYQAPGGITTAIRMQNDARTQLNNHSANLNYSLDIDSAGSSFFAGAQYNRFQNQLADNITESIAERWFNRRNRGNSAIELYTLQADWVKKYANNTLEAGAKYYQVRNAGDIRFFSKALSDANFTENTTLANATRYRETVPALYAAFKQQHHRWDWSAGVRAEYSQINGYSFRTEQTFIDTAYLNLFPHAKIAWKPADSWQCSASYARKINRPLYQDLDPFLWYLDSLTSIQGNPRLTPEFLHQTELSVAFRQLVLRGGYTLSENTIWTITQPGSVGEGSSVYLKTNFQQRHVGNIALDVPLERGRYSGFNTIACFFYRFSDQRPGFAPAATRPQWYLYTYHQWRMPRWCTLELSAEYYGASADGFNTRKPYYYATLAASRSFLQNTLSVQLSFNDVFRTARWQVGKTINTVTSQYNQRFNAQYLRLSVQYRFGQLRQWHYRNRSVNDKEFSRIKK